MNTTRQFFRLIPIYLALVLTGCATTSNDEVPTAPVTVFVEQFEIDNDTDSHYYRFFGYNEPAELGVVDAGLKNLPTPEKYATLGSSLNYYDVGGNGQVVASMLNENGDEGLDLWKIASANARLTSTTNFHFTPSVSKDGESVYFSSVRGRKGSRTNYIWRMPAQGTGNMTRIGAPGFLVRWPSESPNGEYLLYSVKEDIEEPFEIWFTTTTGAVATQMGFGEYPTWLGDEQILYQNQDESTTNYNVWRINADGTERTELISNAGLNSIHAEADPSGRFIAYVKEDPKIGPESRDIFVYRVSDGKSQQVTSNISRDDLPRWSEDGTYLFFRSTRGVEWGIWRLKVTR